ncbi:MAG: cytochrome c-type biogenesis protein [Gammaproteobacteria bacterium]|nr:cytochrome c-type biogenesis protein [Gammaproteobacteria bacterium]
MRTIVVLMTLLSLSAHAAIDAYEFPDEALETRYTNLIEKLRCPQCLNTNLAGSDAMIAKDLRREVHRMLLEGKSDEEILAFMHERYGDFILYEPRVTPATLVLWYGPFVLLGVGALIAGAVIWRRRRNSSARLTGDEQARLNQLLSK